MDAGKPLLADDDGRVGLVVLQLDVVPRLVLFDEAVLEQQGIHLRLDHDEADVGDFLDEEPGLAVLVGLLAEVAGHPLEALGLADVQQGALRIIVLVDPRLVGQALEDALDVRRGFHWSGAVEGKLPSAAMTEPTPGHGPSRELVTGATGLVGMERFAWRLERGWPTVALRRAGSDVGRVQRLLQERLGEGFKAAWSGLEWREADLSDVVALEEAMEGLRPGVPCGRTREFPVGR